MKYTNKIMIKADFGFNYLVQIPSVEYDIRKIVEYRAEEKIMYVLQ